MITLEDIIIDMCEQNNVRYKKNHSDIAIQCPFHYDVNPSLYIKIDGDNQGINYCFACGHGFPMIDIIEEITGNSKEFLKNYGIKLYDYKEDDDFEIHVKVPKQIEELKWEYKPKEIISEWCKWYHPYLEKRGISVETAQRFSLGFDSSDNTVTFPVFDVNNELITVTKRSIEGKNFYLERGIPKPIYLLNEAKRYEEEFLNKNGRLPVIYVCESQIDALKLWQWGYPAIALLGCGNQAQYNYIKNNLGCDRWYMCFDGDKAGDKGASKWKEAFKYSTRIKIPKGKDIGDLTCDEFNQCLTESIDNAISIKRIGLF